MCAEIMVRNIGKGNWIAGPRRAWVSKSDITQFLRCKYRVFLAHKYNKSFDEFVDSITIRFLIEQGSRFEGSIISQMPFKEVESVESVLDERVMLKSTELIQNNELGLKGIVDLIDIERGKLYPIEVKYHKSVEESDKLELAFYWKLLEPLRKRKPKPKGYVWLNTGEMVEVPLSANDFVQLDNLINQIRLVKEMGAEPVICRECKSCVLQQECWALVYKRGGLSSVHGIGEIRQKELSALGIKDLHALATAERAELHKQWRQTSRYAPGVEEIGVLQFRAISLAKEKPIYFGSSALPYGDKVAILDLEYEQNICIWLVGFLASDGQETQCHQFFADQRTEEKQILMRLIELVKGHPRHQIITWEGTFGADIPQLNQAWARHKLPTNKLRDLEREHRDLYDFVEKNLALPVKSYSLKEVGKCLGFKRKLEDMDGMMATIMYRKYLTSKNNKERMEIKQKLLQYNKEDLEATLYILGWLKLVAGETIPS